MVLQMSSDFLSQDEIEALLHGDGGQNTTDLDSQLSSLERDTLGEVGNISFGTAATTLSTILRQKVSITTPQVTLHWRTEFIEDFPLPHVAARVEYTEGLKGSNILMILEKDAKIIADLMLGGDGLNPTEDLTELHLSAVGEAMNQMMGSASTSMSTMIGKAVNISPPNVQKMDSTNSSSFVPDADILVKISFHLQVGELIDSSIMQVIPIEFAKDMIAMIMGTQDSGSEPVVETQAPMPSAPIASSSMDSSMMGSAGYGQAANAYAANGAQRAPSGSVNTPPQAPVEKAVFSSFDQALSPKSGRNLDLLLDIPLQLTVELGRTKKQIRDILELGSGSIIELDALAGEPVDILVNNKLIARGEVVVIDENFGVRVTDIISPAERIARLQ